VERSASLPLHEGLIVTTDGKDTVSLEHAVGDVLRVATVGSALASLSDGVTEDTDVAPVIASKDKSAVFIASNSVDLGAILTSGEDAVNVPGELDSLGCPHDRLGVGDTSGVLINASSFTDVPEEELVSLAGRSKPLGVVRPIHSLDSRRVLGSSSSAGPVSGVVEADLVVMRTNGKELTAGRDSHDLNPLLSLRELGAASIGSMDVNNTVISSDDSLSIRSHDYRARALRSRLVGDGGSSSLDSDLAVGHSPFLHALAVLMVPDDDLVVISRSDYTVSIIGRETPDFSIVVRFHDDLSRVVFADDSDASISASDNQVAVFLVDSTDKVAHLDSSGSGGSFSLKSSTVPL